MNENENELRDEVVVEPRASRMDPALHQPAILSPVGALTVTAARLYQAKKKLLPLTPASAYTVRHKGRRLSLVGPAMGAAASAFVLERMIANGVRKVIMIGFCGSIHPEVRIGDLVAPTEALIEEGVSRQYLKVAKRSAAGAGALAAIQETLGEAGKSYHLGPVWTTDAVFRETKSKVKALGERGVLAVDMETSALFTIAAYRGIELGALLAVSDELFDLKWRVGFTRPRFLMACRHLSHLARAAALKLAGETEPAQLPPEPEAPEEPEDDQA